MFKQASGFSRLFALLCWLTAASGGSAARKTIVKAIDHS
jgi:hypothetical protein